MFIRVAKAKPCERCRIAHRIPCQYLDTCILSPRLISQPWVCYLLGYPLSCWKRAPWQTLKDVLESKKRRFEYKVLGKMYYRRLKVKLEQSKYSCPTYVRGVGGELAVKRILESKGYEVKRNHPHGPDLVVEGRVSVEVKTAGWHNDKRRNSGSYTFRIRWNTTASHKFDGYVLVLRCLSNPPVHFVIPRYAILEGQQNIAICTQNAREHTGKWHGFREAWAWIDAALDNSPNNCIFTRLNLRKE